jgi:hypothetical protein
MKTKRWFALIPYNRYVRTERGFEVMGIYWMRPVILTWTLWNGWTAFADVNDKGLAR